MGVILSKVPLLPTKAFEAGPAAELWLRKPKLSYLNKKLKLITQFCFIRRQPSQISLFNCYYEAACRDVFLNPEL